MEISKYLLQPKRTFLALLQPLKNMKWMFSCVPFCSSVLHFSSFLIANPKHALHVLLYSTGNSIQSSGLCNVLYGERILKKKKRVGICINITDWLCSTPETNATLQTNYTQIKFLKINKLIKIYLESAYLSSFDSSRSLSSLLSSPVADGIVFSPIEIHIHLNLRCRSFVLAQSRPTLCDPMDCSCQLLYGMDII